MAGMEQRFERSLRDGHWTKPLVAFVNPNDVNTPERVGRLLEKALCADLRSGDFPYLPEIVQEFCRTHFDLSNAHRWQLFILGANDMTVLAQYQARCEPYLEAAALHPHLRHVEALVDLGYEHLSAACLDYTVLAASPEEAAAFLVSEYFRRHVTGKLTPARELRADKRGLSPEEVFLTQDEALRCLPLVSIVTQAIQGKEKIKASRTTRPVVRLTDSVAVRSADFMSVE